MGRRSPATLPGFLGMSCDIPEREHYVTVHDNRLFIITEREEFQ